MDRVEVLTCSIEDYMSKMDSPINKVAPFCLMLILVHLACMFDRHRIGLETKPNHI